MEPHRNKRYAVGADVGGSHVCSAVIDLRTGEMAGPVCEMPLDSKAGASVILDVLSRSIAGAVEAADAAGMVAGAGLAFPGPFDYVHGVSTVHGVGKYDRIYGLDLSSSLYSLLCGHGICSFRFVNDAAAFALGECAAGAAAGAARVVAVTLGTGVGSGFVEDGALVESGDRVPACGWVYHLLFGDGIADGEFSTRWICRRFFELAGRKVAGAKDVADECMKRIFLPTIRAMETEGCPFRGCLYFGLMLTAQGPKVIEYNARFGDPETQVVLPLLEGDLLEIMLATREGRLKDVSFSFSSDAACCVVMASAGYPGSYEKGKEITIDDGLEEKLFIAGAVQKDGRLITSGGRVLGLTARAATLPEAMAKAYEGVSKIHFAGAFFRHDIGRKALEAK